MKFIATIAFALSLWEAHHVVGAPLSTKAPKTKSSKAPSAVPSQLPSVSPSLSFSPSLSMSPSETDACGNTCSLPSICMLTFQEEGVIIKVGSSAVVTAPLEDGEQYRICLEGSGDCVVPKGYSATAVSWSCRTPGSSIIQESCTAADALATSTYACADDGNPTALGEFELFYCPGDIRCLTTAPSIAPSASPTKSTKLAKSATRNPTSMPTTSPDSCDNICVDPQICMLTYQLEGVIIEAKNSAAVGSTNLEAGTYRACPSGSGDCEVPAGYTETGPSNKCRDIGTGIIQESCSAAAAAASSTYACADDSNPAALGTFEVFTCPNASDSRCAPDVDRQ